MQLRRVAVGDDVIVFECHNPIVRLGGIIIYESGCGNVQFQYKHAKTALKNFAIRDHSFSTYAQRGRGVKQKRTPCVQGGRGLTRGSTYAKTSLFARVL